MTYYTDEINRRREIAAIYNEELSNIKQLHLPPSPDANNDYFDVYQNYEIQAENRDQLKLFLSDNGIGTLIQWNGQAVHSIKELGFSGKGLPYTEEMFKKCLMIPMNTSLTNDQVKYVFNKIKEFYAE